MHEYLLYSQIPAGREKQILNILAGITGTQPVPIAEQTLIYAQTRVLEQPVNKKAKPQQQQQRIEHAFHKIHRNLDIKDDNTVEAGPWVLRADRTPDPGVHNIISRRVTETSLSGSDIERIKSPEWYRYKQQYTVIGNRYVHNNLVVRIVRYWIPEEASSQDPMDAPPYPPSALKLLDPSGALVIETSVRVGESNNSKLTEQATTELKAFQKYVDGVIDLSAPDRLCLDTRVRNV